MEKLTILRASFLAIALVFLLPACEFLDAMGGDCASLQQQLNDAKAREGALYDSIQTEGAFSMALVFNQETVNKMFRAATEWKYEADLGIASIVVQLPLIQLEGVNDCKDCVIFDIPLTAKIMGLGTLDASAAFAFPIESRTFGTEKTAIYANLRDAKILKLAANGREMPQIAIQPITELLKIYLRDQLGLVHLFDVAAWELGDNNVKLLAGAPRVNSKERTLTFGMYSNLIMSLSTSVQWDEHFPPDAEMALHIHPELIRAIIARMLHEGHIDRNVQLVGDGSAGSETSASSGFSVTMGSMNADVFPAGDYFNMGFRLWKTDTGCGYMDIAAGIKLSVSDEKFTFGIGDIKVVGSAGSGTLYAVLINTLTSTPFFQQVLSFSNITVNFNEISVPTDDGGMRKAPMGSQKFILSLSGDGISLYLNFLDL
ncbi:MAG: hypothetical protein WC966_10830 [Bradymonadales bacterium]|jgi:hypothetical protein